MNTHWKPVAAAMAVLALHSPATAESYRQEECSTFTVAMISDTQNRCQRCSGFLTELTDFAGRFAGSQEHAR